LPPKDGAAQLSPIQASPVQASPIPARILLEEKCSRNRDKNALHDLPIARMTCLLLTVG
jgi:hypothetical protein